MQLSVFYVIFLFATNSYLCVLLQLENELKGRQKVGILFGPLCRFLVV
jgi:hypothetical protein